MSAPDPELYRPNVGIALFNRAGQVFFGRRVGSGGDDAAHAWQFPQGGVDAGEDVRAAALREMEEEIGVEAVLVEILAETPHWLFYDFPPSVKAGMGKRSRFRGQRQKWFALRFLGQDSDVRLDLHKPEFEAWRWGPLIDAPGLVIPFKRGVYTEIAQLFAPYARPVAE